MRQVSERAETYLRLLAEAAIRPASPGTPPGATERADRVRRAADILVDAGALEDGQATEILLMLGTALRVRGQQGPQLGGRPRRLASLVGLGQPAASARARSSRAQSQASAPAQPLVAQQQPQQQQASQQQAAIPDAPWRVIQAAPGQVPGSRLMALIVTADRMIAPATLRFPPSAGLPELARPSFADLTASDDAGTDYLVSFTHGMWAGSTWTGTIMLRPPPPPAARQITITGSSGPVLTSALPAHPGAGPVSVAAVAADDSPGERLLHRSAESLLGTLAGAPDGPGGLVFPSSPAWRRGEVARVIQALGTALPPPAAPAALSLPAGALGTGPAAFGFALPSGPDAQPDLPEIIATLEGAGILSPLSRVPAELAALSQVLSSVPRSPRGSPGGDVPGGAPPATRLPARWASVLAYYGRRHHPSPGAGTGSIGAVLPEVDGARFVIAGIRAGLAGTVLHVVGRGLRSMPRPSNDMGFSWWARDGDGTWHLGVVQGWHVAGDDTVLRLGLLPPLRPGHPETAQSLTVEVTGTTQRLTTDLTVHW